MEAFLNGGTPESSKSFDHFRIETHGFWDHLHIWMNLPMLSQLDHGLRFEPGHQQHQTKQSGKDSDKFYCSIEIRDWVQRSERLGSAMGSLKTGSDLPSRHGNCTEMRGGTVKKALGLLVSYDKLNKTFKDSHT
jgi:hypothetical protein